MISEQTVATKKKINYEKKTGVKFVSVKASSPQIRRTRVPNMGRRIIYTEGTTKVTKYEKYANTKDAN